MFLLKLDILDLILGDVKLKDDVDVFLLGDIIDPILNEPIMLLGENDGEGGNIEDVCDGVASSNELILLDCVLKIGLNIFS